MEHLFSRMESMLNTVCSNLTRRKDVFRNIMEEEFAPIIKSGKQNNNFDWTRLKMFYNKRKNELKNVWAVRIYCEFAFKLFFTFNCEDDEFVIKIVRLYHQMMLEYEKYTVCGRCKQFPSHYLEEDIKDSRPLLKNVNKLDLNTYKFNNRDIYARLVVIGLTFGVYPLMQFLVKFGLSYCDGDDTFERARMYLWVLFSNYTSLKEEPILEDDGEHFVMMFLVRLHQVDLRPNLRRINLIVLTLNFSIAKRVGERRHAIYQDCVKLYGSTLPEVGISLKDVHDVLSLAFPDDPVFVEETVSEFRDIFPDTPDLPSPRPLKYLCRCKVRDHIQKEPTLEMVLSKMCTPIPVKDYLLYMSD